MNKEEPGQSKMRLEMLLPLIRWYTKLIHTLSQSNIFSGLNKINKSYLLRERENNSNYILLFVNKIEYNNILYKHYILEKYRD